MRLQATIKIREVLAWKLPDLTLEMCRKMVKDADDIEDFRKKAREAIQTDASMELQVRTQLVECVLRQCVRWGTLPDCCICLPA